MMNEPPKIDVRTAAEIEQQVRSLLKVFVPEWREYNSNGGQDRLAAALIGIFGRFAELIIQRLNKVPNKNLLAFLDLLGASLQPPQPAQVPLTFSLSAGNTTGGIVPKGTQVASPPGEGEAEPVIFETQRELVVTAAQLDAIFSRDPGQDSYADHSSLTATAALSGKSILEGDTQIDHILYVGDKELFGLSDTTSELAFTLDTSIQDSCLTKWERWSDNGWMQFADLVDLKAKSSISISDIKGLIPESEVNGISSRWIRGILKTRIIYGTSQQIDKLRESNLPKLKTLKLTGNYNVSDQPIQYSFFNQSFLDTSKDFFPFGEKPKIGDVWYIKLDEKFAQSGSKIDLTIDLQRHGTGNTPQLTWETWEGKWNQIASTSISNPSLTSTGSSIIKIVNPDPIPTIINGIAGIWIRGRLSSGDYGKEAEFKSPNTYTPATFSAPIVKKVIIAYAKTFDKTPVVLTSNNLIFTSPVLPFSPYRSLNQLPLGGEKGQSIYLGFTLPVGYRPALRPISIYFNLDEPKFDENAGVATARPELAWECWNGNTWVRLTVNDNTDSLQRQGVVEFLPPTDFAQSKEFGLTRHWVRACLVSGGYKTLPRVQRVLVNTTLAFHATSHRDELLGSSDGSKNQRFRAENSPILDDPCLEINEPELPSVSEQRKISIEEGDDTIRIVNASAGQPRQIWVRWHEVPDFYGSGARDRHYVLNHLSGEVRFGDGINGLIPPGGVSNIKFAHYRTGGGQKGNRPAGSIVQMKTTVPYVDKVTNYIPSTGGADAESVNSLVNRAPRTIRHNSRAVTIEDYEDLAMLASPEVARAKCVPLRNLIATPYDDEEIKDPAKWRGRGQVSVIIVPRSSDPMPVPGRTLIERVEKHLLKNSVPTIQLWVTGPLYLRVDVDVTIALTSMEEAGKVEQRVQQCLNEFLHPLTGGLDQNGWEFGRKPHKSDLYALLESLPGVDHIESLSTTIESANPDIEKIQKSGRFLVYSGEHKVALVFDNN